MKQPVFSFPDGSELQNKWVRFVNQEYFIPIRHNGICIKHFDSKYLVHGDKRATLNRHLQPVPTIYNGDLLEEFVKKPSVLPYGVVVSMFDFHRSEFHNVHDYTIEWHPWQVSENHKPRVHPSHAREIG